jgi:hypothetical protein
MRWRATSVRPSAKGDLGEVDRLLQLGASPDAVATGEPALCAAAVGGRGLHSFTSQHNLSRFGHTSPLPLSDRLGGSHAPNVSNKMCLR